MVYVGIDQALEHTGIAVLGVNDNLPLYLGVIAPKPRTGVTRLAYIRDSLQDILSRYKPSYAALEGYAYEATGRTFDLGEVGGLVRLLYHDHSIPFVVPAPAALKKFVTGNPQATKPQMRKATLLKWGQDIEQNDACDAYGLAQLARVYHTGNSQVRSELEVVTQLGTPKQKSSRTAHSRTRLSL